MFKTLLLSIALAIPSGGLLGLSFVIQNWLAIPFCILAVAFGILTVTTMLTAVFMNNFQKAIPSDMEETFNLLTSNLLRESNEQSSSTNS